jgi:hypothetical protein
MNGNKFATSRILNKPIGVVKGLILAGGVKSLRTLVGQEPACRGAVVKDLRFGWCPSLLVAGRNVLGIPHWLLSHNLIPYNMALAWDPRNGSIS